MNEKQQRYQEMLQAKREVQQRVDQAQAQLVLLYEERTRIERALEKAKPVMHEGFGYLLTILQVAKVEVAETETVLFTLTPADMKSRWLTYMQLVSEKAVQSLPPEPALGVLTKRFHQLLNEEDQGIPKKRQGWQLAVPFLNYCNQHGSYSEAHRDLARGFNNFCHALEPKWGVGWFWHGISEIEKHIPDYESFAVSTITSLLTAPGINELLAEPA